MARNPATIDLLRIATPCPISWDQMTGDNRVRPRLIDTPPGITIFDEKMIKSLPHQK
jgi:hypothetical protein